MRAFIPMLLLAVEAALAQGQGAAASAPCKAVTGPPDINDRGEFALPTPTQAQCDAVAALVERFLAMAPRDFRRVVTLESVPGKVRVHVGRIAPYGRPWNSDGGLGSSLPGKRHVVTWLSDTIVVIVYETGDFVGPATSVLISDLENLQVCEYPRWPFDEDPRRLSIEEIQEALDSGRMADRAIPACHLEPLVID
jgi:hypothetical protein